MMYEFECGCVLPQLGDDIKNEDGLPPLEIDYYNIRHDCPIAWQVFYEGKTKGVFQLEKGLGKTWSKKIQPASIEEVSALVSLIRPGCLKAIVDGKSMTQHYADRKMGIEPITYIHESIQEVLAPTLGVLTYQEQSMRIAQIVAAFTLMQADTLRKAIGKKKADVMAKVKIEYMEGCKAAGIVPLDIAEAIFDNIEKSNRYAFNKSHGVEYAEISYWCAYAKAHFPLHFFTAFLEMSNEKMNTKDEVCDLVEDAKAWGIEVYPPLIDSASFTMNKKGIHFGLKNVKSVGSVQIVKLMEHVRKLQTQLNKSIQEWTWFEILAHLSEVVNKTVFNNLISVGVFNKTSMSRQAMLHEYSMWNMLTAREKKFIIDNCGSLKSGINYLIQKDLAIGKRKETIKGILDVIEKPPYEAEDSPKWLIGVENEILGTSITCSQVDNINSSGSNTTCLDFINGKSEKEMTLAIEIAGVREYIVKSGKNIGKPMGFLTLRDNSGSIEATIFTDLWAKVKNVAYKGNVCSVMGYRSDRDGLVIKRIKEIC